MDGSCRIHVELRPPLRGGQYAALLCNREDNSCFALESS